MLTDLALVKIYGIKPTSARAWLPHLAAAFAMAEIVTTQRAACFLAQIGHESGRLRYTKEIWGPTPQQLRYEAPTTLARRLGNSAAGDGKRYQGRGLIQTTGRANYAMTRDGLREILGKDEVPDFVIAPKMLELPLWAALSAALFWKKRKLNFYADQNNFAELTRRINGGYNGMADRQALYTAAISALQNKG